jgi:hypothetical protein
VGREERLGIGQQRGEGLGIERRRDDDLVLGTGPARPDAEPGGREERIDDDDPGDRSPPPLDVGGACRHGTGPGATGRIGAVRAVRATAR